jgi:hypothetical protein
MNDLPTTRLLFLDTNALVKRFVGERGHDVLMWLDASEAILGFTVHVMTSVHVRDEFPRTIEKMLTHNQISGDEARGVLARSNGYISVEFPGLDIVDTGPLPGFNDGGDTSLDHLIAKHNLKDCDRTDCAIMASIINYLRCFGGGSLPHVVTSDRRFKRMIKAEGFGVIDPEKTTVEELKAYLTSLT